MNDAIENELQTLKRDIKELVNSYKADETSRNGVDLANVLSEVNGYIQHVISDDLVTNITASADARTKENNNNEKSGNPFDDEMTNEIKNDDTPLTYDSEFWKRREMTRQLLPLGTIEKNLKGLCGRLCAAPPDNVDIALADKRVESFRVLTFGEHVLRIPLNEVIPYGNDVEHVYMREEELRCVRRVTLRLGFDDRIVYSMDRDLLRILPRNDEGWVDTFSMFCETIPISSLGYANWSLSNLEIEYDEDIHTRERPPPPFYESDPDHKSFMARFLPPPEFCYNREGVHFYCAAKLYPSPHILIRCCPSVSGEEMERAVLLLPERIETSPENNTATVELTSNLAGFFTVKGEERQFPPKVCDILYTDDENNYSGGKKEKERERENARALLIGDDKDVPEPISSIKCEGRIGLNEPFPNTPLLVKGDMWPSDQSHVRIQLPDLEVDPETYAKSNGNIALQAVPGAVAIPLTSLEGTKQEKRGLLSLRLRSCFGSSENADDDARRVSHSSSSSSSSRGAVYAVRAWVL